MTLWRQCQILSMAATCIALNGCGYSPQGAGATADGLCDRRADGAWSIAAQRECFRSLPKLVVSGYWVRAFEHSAFYADRESAQTERDPSAAWLELSPSAQSGIGSLPQTGKQIFEVTLEGRIPEGTGHFGHMGMYERVVYVDKFLKINEITN
jgi:hypothetical protein